MDFFVARVSKELGIDEPEYSGVPAAEMTALIERRVLERRSSTRRLSNPPSAKKRKTREVLQEATTEILPIALALTSSPNVAVREASVTVLLSHIVDNLKFDYYPKLEQLRLLKLQQKGDKEASSRRLDTLKDDITQLSRKLSTLVSVIFPKRLQDSAASVRLSVVSGLSSLGATGLPTLKGSALELKMKPISMMHGCLGDRDGSVRTAALNAMTHWLECYPKTATLFPLDDILGCSFDDSKTVQCAAVRFIATAASQDEGVLDKLKNPDLIWHVLWDLEISQKAKEGVAKMVIKHILPNSPETDTILRALIAFIAEFQPDEKFACIAGRVFPAFSSALPLKRINPIAEICLDPTLEPLQLDAALQCLFWVSSQNPEDSISKIRQLLEIAKSDIHLYLVASAFTNLPSPQVRDVALENFIFDLCKTAPVLAVSPLVNFLAALNPLRLSELCRGSLPLIRACELSSNSISYISDSELEDVIMRFPKMSSVQEAVSSLDIISTAALKRSNDEFSAKFFDCCHQIFLGNCRDLKIFASLRCVAMARHFKIPCPHKSLISGISDELMNGEDLLLPGECSWGFSQNWIAEALLRDGKYSDQTAPVLAELIAAQISEF